MKQNNKARSNSNRVHQNYHRNTKTTKKIVKVNNFTYRLLIDVLKSKIQFSNNSYVLDVGCGAGSISLYLASKGVNVIGIDISKKAINECNKSAKELKLRNIKFIHTYFPDEINIYRKFDSIIFTEVIEHLEDDNKAIITIHKLLRPNGLLIISTPSINAPLHKLGLTKKFDKEVGHLRRYSLTQLQKLLNNNGFKIIETKKTEGILRNFLFVNPYAGKLVRYVNFFASDFVTFLDNISLKLFGESNYIIVARKIQKRTSGVS